MPNGKVIDEIADRMKRRTRPNAWSFVLIAGVLWFCLGFAAPVVAQTGQTASQPQTIKVPEDYETISEAIRVARNGGTVLVAPGTYDEGIVFSGKNIMVRSTSPEGILVTKENADAVKRTVIEGDVRFHNGETAKAVLTGFTLDGQRSAGDVVAILSGSPTLSNNVIKGNGTNTCIAVNGGAPIIKTNYVYSCSDAVKLTTNGPVTLEGNTVNQSLNAIVVEYSSPTIKGNVIVGNGNFYTTPPALGNQELVTGGTGISIEGFSTATNSGNIISGNGGAGISIIRTNYQSRFFGPGKQGLATIEGNKIETNNAGAVRLNSASAKIVNNTIASNRNSRRIVGFPPGITGPHDFKIGLGVSVQSGSSAVVSNNTLESNVAVEHGGALWVSKDSQIKDQSGNLIAPPRRGDKEPNNTYGSGDKANVPDDAYFE